MSKSNNKMKKKIVSFFLVILLLFLGIIGKLVYIMIVKGEDYKKEAIEQQTRDRLITPKRGTIYDRNGKPLAVSASVETVSISPISVRKAKRVEETAKVLSEVLEVDYQFVLNKIDKKTSYEIIKKKVEKDKADQIRAAELPGVYLDEDTKRYYPYGNFASHVIGFTGVDNQGLLGIEMVYDSVLKGKPGRVVAAKSADGTEMPYKYERYYNPEEGTNIVLTIDQTIQHFLEKHLETATIDNKLQKGAAGIIIDVKTGEILAMATKPDFDLNNPFEIKDTAVKQRLETITDKAKRQEEESKALLSLWRNKAVVDSYEPGSTFKIIVSATGLETGRLSLNDRFVCNGYKKVGGYTIRCWKTAGHGEQNFVDGIKNSCNPVFMDIGERIGHEDFYKYYKAFGFTEKTGIELTGETSGIFYPMSNFNVTELATSSFGQGFQITPLQMITAVACVANKGLLMKPHLVKYFMDDEGTITRETEPQIVRQVISEETSRLLRQLLEDVVVDGTGKSAFVKGYHIAGKTGTSEKQPRGNQKYIASFVGFAPATDPMIACLIILDEPGGGQHMGGLIAAPVVKNIMEDCLIYMGIEPDLADEEKEKEVSVPHVIGKTVSEARQILNASSLKYKVEGSGEIILDQIPKANVVVAESATVILYTEQKNESSKVVVPKLIGLNYNDVSEKLSSLGLNLITNELPEDKATVKAASQDPAEGTIVELGSSVKVQFQQ